MTAPHLPTSQVVLPKRCPKLKSSYCVINASEAYGWLESQRSIVGWTWRITEGVLDELNLKRIIAVHVPFPDLRFRIVDNVHAKCYISPKGVYVGSLNLVQPSLQEFGVIITDKKIRANLLKQFDYHWKALA